MTSLCLLPMLHLLSISTSSKTPLPRSSWSTAGTQEHEELARALALIKGALVQVDALVNLHEKSLRLRDFHSKMEPKAQGKIKDGRLFRREDLAPGRRRLLHEGTVNWKAASGRLKGELSPTPCSISLLLKGTYYGTRC